MKKYTLFSFVFFLSLICFSLLGFLGFTNSASADYPPWDQVGCTAGMQYNPYSGKPCVSASNDVSTKTSYDFGTVTLRNGSRGEAVKELQRFLNTKLNLGLVIDGALGPKTILVIKTWQQNHNLVADGLIGAKTKAMMNAEAAHGSDSTAVEYHTEIQGNPTYKTVSLSKVMNYSSDDYITTSGSVAFVQSVPKVPTDGITYDPRLVIADSAGNFVAVSVGHFMWNDVGPLFARLQVGDTVQVWGTAGSINVKSSGVSSQYAGLNLDFENMGQITLFGIKKL